MEETHEIEQRHSFGVIDCYLSHHENKFCCRKTILTRKKAFLGLNADTFVQELVLQFL